LCTTFEDENYIYETTIETTGREQKRNKHPESSMNSLPLTALVCYW